MNNSANSIVFPDWRSLSGFSGVKPVFGALLLASALCLPARDSAGAGGIPALPDAALEISVPIPVPAERPEETRLSGGQTPEEKADREKRYAKKFSRAAERTYRQKKNYITLNILRSPKDMDWSSATSMFRSYFSNAMGDDHSVGHVAFEIGCVSDSGRTTVVTGQTDASNSKSYLSMWWSNMGYNVFFGHVPGIMQTREQVEADFGEVSKMKDRVAFATFLVSPQSCAEAVRFVKAYESEKVYTRFGINQRPLHKEGACCANLAAAVLRVAGVTEYDDDWSRTFYIPKRLLHTRAPSEQSVLDTLGLYDWSVRPDGPYRVLHFFDPDLMYRWASSNRSAEKVNGHAVTGGYAIGSSRGFVVDYGDSSPTSWWLSD
ncbi:MAG: hypothetical protein WC421_02725 [Elusimicrobiales bacterium]